MQGTLWGSYRIQTLLGEGGMARVYLAEHNLIGRKVAIKVLLPEYSEKAEVVDRFFNEARAAAAIKHPGIVDVYDFGQHQDGSAYLVMEYLQGESLADWLPLHTPLPLAMAVEIIRQLASALVAAHKQNIIHRDLKPDNIFIVHDAELATGVRAKILDFGIAKLIGDTTISTKTQTGIVMGTPAYMSPEQCRAAAYVDHRSDIYSLGCVLFELACGRPPFLGEAPGDLIAAHILSPLPSPTSINPALPPSLDALLTHALAKAPDARIQTMAQLLAELEKVARSLPPPSLDEALGIGGSSEEQDEPILLSRQSTLSMDAGVNSISSVASSLSLSTSSMPGASMSLSPSPLGASLSPSPSPSPASLSAASSLSPAIAEAFAARPSTLDNLPRGAGAGGAIEAAGPDVAGRLVMSWRPLAVGTAILVAGALTVLAVRTDQLPSIFGRRAGGSSAVAGTMEQEREDSALPPSDPKADSAPRPVPAPPHAVLAARPATSSPAPTAATGNAARGNHRKIIHILSTRPPGARVIRVSDATEIGVTPLVDAREAVKGQERYLVRLDGYSEGHVVLRADKNNSAQVVLKRQKGAAAVPKVEETPRGFVDPFADGKTKKSSASRPK